VEQYEGRGGGRVLHEELCAGHEVAWTYLYRWVLARARNGLRDRASDAPEELTQGFLLRLRERGLATVTQPAGFYGFLTTSLRRAVIDFVRKEGRTVSPDPDGPPVADGAAHGPAHAQPFVSAEATSNLLSVLRAVARLEGRCREILTTLIRVTLEGGKVVEVADALEIKRSSIHTLVKRCLDRFHALPV